MFIRKKEIELKSGEVSISYQAVVMVRRGDKKVRKAINLRDYANPMEALNWERKCLEQIRYNANYPLNKYLEVRHSAKYNCPVVVSVPLDVAKKRRMMWIKLLKKQEERVRVLEKLETYFYQKTNKKVAGS